MENWQILQIINVSWMNESAPSLCAWQFRDAAVKKKHGGKIKHSRMLFKNLCIEDGKQSFERRKSSSSELMWDSRSHKFSSCYKTEATTRLTRWGNIAWTLSLPHFHLSNISPRVSRSYSSVASHKINAKLCRTLSSSLLAFVFFRWLDVYLFLVTLSF